MEKHKTKKANRKTLKQSSRYRLKRVSNVKPYPIPELEGEAAKVFEEQIKEPPTDIQKRMIAQGTVVFAEIKKHK